MGFNNRIQDTPREATSTVRRGKRGAGGEVLRTYLPPMGQNAAQSDHVRFVGEGELCSERSKFIEQLLAKRRST